MNERGWFRKTERYLYDYDSWKIYLDNLEGGQGIGFVSLEDLGNEKKDSEPESIAERKQVPPWFIIKIDMQLQNLNEEQKQLFELKYIKEWTHKEIWQEMSIGKNKFYEIRDRVVEKFAIALGFKPLCSESTTKN